MRPGPVVEGCIAPRSSGMDSDQVAPMNDDLVAGPGDPIFEIFDLNLGKMELFMRVQEVRQPVSSEPDPAKHAFLQPVCDEPNEGCVGDRIRLEDLLRRGLE